MRYRRIHIIGGPGSGKSYIADHLSRKFGIPTFTLDDLFWDNAADRYGIRATEEERDRRLGEILDRDAWIVEGVYHQWLARSFMEADIIVVLTTSVWLRHWRIIRRFLRRRPGLEPSAKKETLRGLWSLLVWNHAYGGDNLTKARAFIEGLGRDVVECSSLEEVLAALNRRDEAHER